MGCLPVCTMERVVKKSDCSAYYTVSPRKRRNDCIIRVMLINQSGGLASKIIRRSRPVGYRLFTGGLNGACGVGLNYEFI